jgi:hypothetical protein
MKSKEAMSTAIHAVGQPSRHSWYGQEWLEVTYIKSDLRKCAFMYELCHWIATTWHNSPLDPYRDRYMTVRYAFH